MDYCNWMVIYSSEVEMKGKGKMFRFNFFFNCVGETHKNRPIEGLVRVSFTFSNVISTGIC